MSRMNIKVVEFKDVKENECFVPFIEDGFDIIFYKNTFKSGKDILNCGNYEFNFDDLCIVDSNFVLKVYEEKLKWFFDFYVEEKMNNNKYFENNYKKYLDLLSYLTDRGCKI